MQKIKPGDNWWLIKIPLCVVLFKTFHNTVSHITTDPNHYIKISHTIILLKNIV